MAMNLAKKQGTKAGAKTKDKTPSWLKRGKSAAVAAKKEEARQKQRQEDSNKLFRFRLQEGESATITFLNGELMDDGDGNPIFDLYHVYEHEVWGFAKKGPSYFVCVQEEEACPLCQDENYASYCAMFLVIDHRGFDKQSGEHVEYSRKLFVAKPQSIKKLMLAAKKRNGLTGYTCEVSRSSKKAARVGDDFEWTEKRTLQQLAKEYPDAKPLEEMDILQELQYKTADELRQMGFGQGAKLGETQPQAAPQGDESDDIPF